MNGKNKTTQIIKTLIAFKIIFVSNFLFGQNYTLSAIVLGENNKPLSNISVQLFKNDSLKDYSFTDIKGNFSFRVENGTYVVKTSSMLYLSVSKRIKINNLSRKLSFKLKEKKTILDEVVLKIERDIEIRKDTIIFKASSFENKRQIVVEDLLRDLPGIQISENGEILFQGKLVTNVKIENDDLFNGGYQVITKNLKADLVDKIQLLQNYSDNPLLKNVRDTEDVAVNITLKENRKTILFGDVDLASNFKNRNNNHANLISFLKKSKHYFIADFNNVGINSFLDFKNIFTSKSDNPTLKIGNNQKTNLYTTLNTIRPNLDDKYVNINNTQLYNFNSIFNVTSNLKLKTVLLAFNNKNNFINNQNTFFVSEPPITLEEKTRINQKENVYTAKVELDWKVGKKSLLEYEGSSAIFSSEAFSNIQALNNIVNETLFSDSKRINHFFNFTQKLKDSAVIQFSSRYIYDNKPQNYIVNPFPYQNTFGDNFDMLESKTRDNLNFFVAQMSLIKNFKSSNLETYLGYHNKTEHLISSVLFRDKDSREFLNESSEYANALKLKQDLFYLKNRYRKNLGNFNISLNLDLDFENNNRSNFRNSIFFYYKGLMNLKYSVLNKHEVNLSSSVNQFTNTLSNLNTGFIPVNYRIFTKGLSDNLLQKNYNLNVNYNYGNWNDKITGGVNAVYSLGDKYVSFNANLNQEIAQVEKIILRGRKEIKTGFYLDRYISFLSSNFKFKANYLNLIYANRVNNLDRNILSTLFSSGLEIRSNFSSFFDFHLGFSFINSSTSINKQKINILNRKGFLDFDFFTEKLVFNLENDFYFFDPKSNITNYIFTNVKGSYKMSNKISFTINAHNIFNNASFDIFSQTDLSQFRSLIPLIGRYVLFGANYKF